MLVVLLAVASIILLLLMAIADFVSEALKVRHATYLPVVTALALTVVATAIRQR